MFEFLRKLRSGGKSLEQSVGRPLELENGQAPGLLSATLFAVSFAVVAAIVWASIAEVHEVAAARGEIVPLGQIKEVQHLEGGIVDQVLVSAGDRVEAGAPILKLRPEAVTSDLGRLQDRLAWLELEDMRLEAELSGAPLDFGARENGYVQAVMQQKATYAANIAERGKVLDSLDARVASRQSAIDTLSTEITLLERQLKTQRELYSMDATLMTKGLTTRSRYLEAKAALQRVETALAAAMTRLAQAVDGRAEAQADRAQASAEYTRRNTERRAQIAEERLELARQITKYSDRFDRLYVRAPVAGMVKDVVPRSAGAVIQPGQVVAEIVPEGQELVAEVKVRPRDIGHIKVGDPADIVITTYDANTYGKLPGKVASISASSFPGGEGEPYFKAVVELVSDATGTAANYPPLLPGMLVDAGIVTGSKSITRYLLKPIYRSFDKAFSER